HQNQVTGQDRRRSHSEWIIEGTQRPRPELIAVGPVGKQTVIAEERVGILAVRRRAGRSRAVRLVQLHLATARRFPPPENFACRAIETDGVELLAFERGEKNAVCRQYRRGMAGGQRRLPDDVLGGTELDRQVLFARCAGAIGSTKLGPIRSRDRQWQQQG